MHTCRSDLIHNESPALLLSLSLFQNHAIACSHSSAPLQDNSHRAQIEVPFCNSPCHTMNTNAEQTLLAVNMYIIIM